MWRKFMRRKKSMKMRRKSKRSGGFWELPVV